jgi:hypothetical protein
MRGTRIEPDVCTVISNHLSKNPGAHQAVTYILWRKEVVSLQRSYDWVKQMASSYWIGWVSHLAKVRSSSSWLQGTAFHKHAWFWTWGEVSRWTSPQGLVPPVDWSVCSKSPGGNGKWIPFRSPQTRKWIKVCISLHRRFDHEKLDINLIFVD